MVTFFHYLCSHVLNVRCLVLLSGLYNVAKLIGCDAGELKLALSTRKMRVGNDTIVQKLTQSQVRRLSWKN